MAEEELAPSSEVRREVKSEGQRLLLVATQGMSQEKVAEMAGCTRPNVSYWMNGKGLPGSTARKVLQAHFGIHPDSWTRKPWVPGEAGAAQPEQPPKRSGVAATSTLDLLNARIEMLGEIVADEERDIELRMRAQDLERKCLAERRGLERDARARESDIVARSPEWADVRRRTLLVLSEFPDAMRAWVGAMGKLAQEQAPAPTEEEEESE